MLIIRDIEKENTRKIILVTGCYAIIQTWLGFASIMLISCIIMKIIEWITNENKEKFAIWVHRAPN